MRPRSLTISSSVSLLLCVVALALWIQSWSHPIMIFFTRGQEQCRVWISAGRVGIDNQPQVAIETAKHERDVQLMRNMSGLDLMAMPPSQVPLKWSRSSSLLLPVIAIALAAIALVPPALRIAFRIARRTRRRCIACGYNLTGNVSGVCPECGEAVNSKSAGPRMIRPRWITIASSVPLVLCLATVILWAESWPHPMTTSFTRGQQQCRAWIDAGRVGLDNEPQVAMETAQYERDLNVTRGLARLTVDRNLMVAPQPHIASKWSRSSALLLPAIAIVLAGIVILPPTLRAACRTIRASRRQCAACGYNLTGNISGVCPECGSSVTSMREGRHA